jgi:superfamily II RNA helicase
MARTSLELPPHKLIRALRKLNLLPVIVFLPTRRRCDEAALEAASDPSRPVENEKAALRKELFNSFAAQHGEVRSHKHRKILINAGIASHHAGHIPSWKLLIEKMMSQGLLNAIFATTTVAAGVDFPARTVLITNADTRGNDGWRPLTAVELQQMTGRAGRRGKDLVGFVVLAPGEFQNPWRIAQLLKSPPDPIESKFRATYTTLLNLLDAFGSFGQIREIVQKSFASHEIADQIQWEETQLRLAKRFINESLAESGLSLELSDIKGFEILSSAVNQLETSPTESSFDPRNCWLKRVIVPGRLIIKAQGGRKPLFVLQTFGRTISVIGKDGRGAFIDRASIRNVFDPVYPVTEAGISQAFQDAEYGLIIPIREPKFSSKPKQEQEAAISLLHSLMEQIAAKADGNPNTSSGLLWELAKPAHVIRSLEESIERTRCQTWPPFEALARVLDELGYVDFQNERVTDEGKWLADVRLDRPVVFGELLRKGVLSHSRPSVIAGLIASVAADLERDYGEAEPSEELIELLPKLEDILYEVTKLEVRYRIPTSADLNLSAAAAAEKWVEGIEWKKLVELTGAEEGDLFRMLSRTREALIQISNLKSVDKQVAKAAFIAAEAIYRDPIE